VSRFDYHRNLVRDGMHPDALHVPEHVRADLLAEAQGREWDALVGKVTFAFFAADEIEVGGNDEAHTAERSTVSGITRSGLRVRLVLEVE
jgi:hypothetical protein